MKRRLLGILLVFYVTLMLLLVLAPQILAKRDTTTACSGTLSRVTSSDLTVPKGAICRISDSMVIGSVIVRPDAYFEARGTKISGSVQAVGALTVFLHDGTSVGGDLLVDGTAQLFLYKAAVGGTAKVTGAVAPGFGHVQVCDSSANRIEIRGSGPDVLVGDPKAACPGNRVKNDIVLVSNATSSQLDVSGNRIAGSLVVTNNTGNSPKQVTNNTVQGRIDLSNNSAPFDASNNWGSAAPAADS